MTPRRAVAALVLASAVVGALGCAGTRRPPASGGAAEQLEFGVYRARVDLGEQGRRSFRLMLWAALPDRLHAEALSPIGSTEWIIDAGAGRLAVSRPRERTAWVGEADAASIERLVGVPAALPDLVAAILLGRPWPGAGELERDPAEGAGLPRRIVLIGERGRLELDRRRRDHVRGDAAALGTGRPPAGVSVEPLDRLPATFEELAHGEDGR